MTNLTKHSCRAIVSIIYPKLDCSKLWNVHGQIWLLIRMEKLPISFIFHDKAVRHAYGESNYFGRISMRVILFQRRFYPKWHLQLMIIWSVVLNYSRASICKGELWESILFRKETAINVRSGKRNEGTLRKNILKRAFS